MEKGIYETIGHVHRQSDSPNIDGGRFLRVQVSRDISQPTCRRHIISLDVRKDQWVAFKYEQLPNLIYWFGCLSHDDKDCNLWFESKGTLSVDNKQFGPWLHAPVDTRFCTNNLILEYD